MNKAKRPRNKIKIANNTIYKVDQSGKIEYTTHDTVIAIANGKSFSILMKASEKRLLHAMFRNAFNKNRQYLYEVFSALVYLLLINIKSHSQVIIDKEYPGKESLIKLHILEYDKTGKILPENIGFGLVGKKSSAHHLAYNTFKKIKKPSKIVKAQELMKVIFPSKKTGYSGISRTEGS